MKKVHFVVRYELWRRFTDWHYLFVTFLLPLLLAPVTFALMIGTVCLLVTADSGEIGIVDHVGFTLNPQRYYEAEQEAFLEAQTILTGTEKQVAEFLQTTVGSHDLIFQRFPDEASATRALADKQIRAFLVIESDYLTTGNLTLYDQGDWFQENYTYELEEYLQDSLLANYAPVWAEPFDNGLSINVVLLEDIEPKKTDQTDNPKIDTDQEATVDSEVEHTQKVRAYFFPFMMGLVFMFAITAVSGDLFAHMREERENRTGEILLTSILPEALIIGKILSIMSLSILQLGCAFILIGVALCAGLIFIPHLFWVEALIGIFWFIPLYIMIMSLVTTASISIRPGESNSLLTLIMFAPIAAILLITSIVNEPNGWLAIILTFIPITAPTTILARIQLTHIPIHQLAISWLILFGCMIAAVRLLRWWIRYNMLGYGNSINWPWSRFTSKLTWRKAK